MTERQFIVSEVRAETDLIRSFRLRAADGGALPAVASGAHIQVQIPGLAEPRCYSLVALSAEAAPTEYRLGVRREENSKGGSAWMHSLSVGQTLTATGPKNEFPLHAAETGEGTVVLIAGGIGITPLASHAAALAAAGRPFVLHYSGRSRSHLALLDELAALCGDALHLHADDEPASRLDVGQLLAGLSRDQHLYVCGPKGLIDSVLATAAHLGWPREKVHFELFVTGAPVAGDQAFELELRQSGLVLQVPADKTILEVLEAAGCDPMFDCRRGECGVCQAVVIEGSPDHRDYFLSEREKAEGKVIQTCISRACSARLVLDL